MKEVGSSKREGKRREAEKAGKEVVRTTCDEGGRKQREGRQKEGSRMSGKRG